MSEILFSDLNEKAEQLAKAPYSPDRTKFPTYRETDVIDEEKSVRWNREEIQKRNSAYNDEKVRLRKVIWDLEVEIDDLACNYIVQETGLTKDKASIVWGKVYGDHHASGYSEVFDSMEDEIYYINRLIK